MDMTKILSTVTFYFLSILILISFIPAVQDDVLLTLIYLLCIALLLRIQPEKYDVVALCIGIIGITLSELFFVSTGVEKFLRTSLFDLIPLWLPFLWGYAFITIKRSLNLLRK